MNLSDFNKRFANAEEAETALHELAKGYLEKGDVITAWLILLSNK
jgi:hypothetical protein